MTSKKPLSSVDGRKSTQNMYAWTVLDTLKLVGLPWSPLDGARVCLIQHDLTTRLYSFLARFFKGSIVSVALFSPLYDYSSCLFSIPLFVLSLYHHYLYQDLYYLAAP